MWGGALRGRSKRSKGARPSEVPYTYTCACLRCSGRRPLGVNVPPHRRRQVHCSVHGSCLLVAGGWQARTPVPPASNPARARRFRTHTPVRNCLTWFSLLVSVKFATSTSMADRAGMNRSSCAGQEQAGGDRGRWRRSAANAAGGFVRPRSSQTMPCHPCVPRRACSSSRPSGQTSAAARRWCMPPPFPPARPAIAPSPLACRSRGSWS